MSEKLAIYGGTPANDSKPRARIISPGAFLAGAEEMDAVGRVIRRQVFYRHWGEEVASFEREVAARLAARHVVALNSGTSALACALAALGIGSSDEVIVPAYCFVGVAGAVVNSGATAVFCDIDDSLTIDASALADLASGRTRAIIAAHMRGAPAALDVLTDFCKQRGFALVEDVAQAFGGCFRGQSLGTWGEVGCFSFQHFKVITTGEGGLLATARDDIYARSLLCHDASAYWSYDLVRGRTLGSPSQVAQNLRMGEIEGAIGRVQLRRLDDLLARLALYKRRILANIELQPGVKLRPSYDATGEVSTAIVFILDPELPSAPICEALRGEGVQASVLLGTDSEIDRHFCAGWSKIGLGKERLRREYECDASAQILRRSIEISIDPLYGDAELEGIAKGLDKVFRYFCAGRQ